MIPEYSILRAEEYNSLSRLTLDGKILDLGGRKNADYHALVKGEHTYTVGNISETAGADIIFDAQKTFPIENESFNHVLCLNVLEHVYDFRTLISESFRVMKKDGVFVAAIPFMHHVHGSPDDFFRYTPSALTRAFTDAGFEHIEIKNLGKGPFSLFYQCVRGGVPTEFFRGLLQLVFVGIDVFLSGVSARYKQNAERMPLGYFVVARK